MPFRLAAITLALLMTVSTVAACGDDDGPSGSPTGTISGSRSATAGPSSTSQPTDTGSDEKTPPPGEETDAPTAAATAPGDIPTAPPTASQGTPAVRPADEAAFLAQFQGLDIEFAGCVYNPSTALTNCAENGLYAIDPPIVGQDITCTLWLIDGTAVAIQCRSVEPAQTIHYEIE